MVNGEWRIARMPKRKPGVKAARVAVRVVMTFVFIPARLHYAPVSPS